MADMTKCAGFECDIKATCKRHVIEPNEYYQSWFKHQMINNGECNFYIPIKLDK